MAAKRTAILGGLAAASVVTVALLATRPAVSPEDQVFKDLETVAIPERIEHAFPRNFEAPLDSGLGRQFAGDFAGGFHGIAGDAWPTRQCAFAASPQPFATATYRRGVEAVSNRAFTPVVTSVEAMSQKLDRERLQNALRSGRGKMRSICQARGLVGTSGQLRKTVSAATRRFNSHDTASIDAGNLMLIDVKAGVKADLVSVLEELQARQPMEVLIGWRGLNNISHTDVSQYDAYAAQIAQAAELVRAYDPSIFIWVTVCAYTATYDAWIQRVAPIGDGIALWNVAFFPIVPRFGRIHAKVFADSSGKPIALAGFYGVKSHAPRPKDFEARMADAEAAAKKAGFVEFWRAQ